MLVSPAKIRLAFCLSINSRTGVNSSINSLRMSLPGFGGLYKLKITVEFCSPPSDTFMATLPICIRIYIYYKFTVKFVMYIYIQ